MGLKHRCHDTHQSRSDLKHNTQVANQLAHSPACEGMHIYLYPSVRRIMFMSYAFISNMEGEISNFIIVWIQVIASLCYCYVIGKIVPKGFPTLLAILPILCLFVFVPLQLHTMHLVGMLAFFISWLANSKLILFAFNKGPLSHPSLSLKHFIVIASFPTMIHSQYKTSPPHKSLLNYTIKSLILVVVPIIFYNFCDYTPPVILYSLYCLYIYLTLEITLTMISVLVVRTLLGIQPGPHFDEPYLSSSLQDFWGRRWNLVASNILRLTVFEPTERVMITIFGPHSAALIAVFVTFVASGLFHEIIFYYLGRVRPTWEITWFFLLHGSCLVVELCCKKKLVTGKFRLPRVVSGPLTLGFVMVTSAWLFFPQLLRGRGDERLLQEFEAVGAFVKKYYSYLLAH